jgi:hypothetical protein
MERNGRFVVAGTMTVSVCSAVGYRTLAVRKNPVLVTHSLLYTELSSVNELIVE